MTDVPEETQRNTVKALLHYLGGADLDLPPPRLSMELHRIIRETTGNPDPYSDAKRESTEMARRLLPRLREIMDASEEPLALAVRLGAAGNVIDYGTFARFDLNETVDMAVEKELDLSDMEAFRSDLEDAAGVLFLGDNAGEILLDTFLLGELRGMGKEITYVVRSGPIINDATMEDARHAGINEYARVIPGGSRSPGTLLEHASPELRAALAETDLILAKGQGNFETLSGNPGLARFAGPGTPIYFLLTIKCPIVAGFAGVPEGSTIFRREEVRPIPAGR